MVSSAKTYLLKSQYFVITILTFSAFSLLNSCGTDNSVKHSELSASQSTPEPIFIVQGGRSSCGKTSTLNLYSPYGIGMFAMFKKMITKLEQASGKKIEYVLSCFTKNGKILSLSSKNPKDIESNKLKGYLTHLEKLWDANSDRKGIVIGHSHGGWLAMKTVQLLANKRSFSTLITLDAISGIKCRYLRPTNCRQAPLDITSEDREQIAEATDFWTNFYQEEDFIRSSKISHADKNYIMNTSHTDMDDSETVWARIKMQLSKIL